MNFLITGASTGIGAACARRLDGGGHRVFAGVRRIEDGERLRAGASDRLHPVNLDVTDPGAVQRAREEIEQRLDTAGLDGLVNNAGIAVAGPLEYLPIDELRRQFEVNVIGQIAVTQAFLPLLRKARGRIVLMGSIAGRLSAPFLAPYSASKFALEAIADSLRLELRPWSVGVSIIEPGSVATPIWEKGAAAADALKVRLPPRASEDYGGAIASVRDMAARSGRRGIPADAVARAVEHALLSPRPKTRYLVGRDARFRALLVQVLPDRLRDRLIARAMNLRG